MANWGVPKKTIRMKGGGGSGEMGDGRWGCWVLGCWGVGVLGCWVLGCWGVGVLGVGVLGCFLLPYSLTPVLPYSPTPLLPHSLTPPLPYLIATCRSRLACNIGVLLTESLAIVNSGLERMPAREVAINVARVTTWSERIPGMFQLATG
jgi:hypothetical protein